MICKWILKRSIIKGKYDTYGIPRDKLLEIFKYRMDDRTDYINSRSMFPCRLYKRYQVVPEQRFLEGVHHYLDSGSTCYAEKPGVLELSDEIIKSIRTIHKDFGLQKTNKGKGKMIIKNKITSASVSKDSQEKEKPKEMHESMQRSYVLQGRTYKVKVPSLEHALYVTINDMEIEGGQVRPFEIFLNSKNNEHVQWIKALAVIISAVFRKGGDISFLCEELKSIFDPAGGHFGRGKYIPSLVAEVGYVLEEHLTSIGLMKAKEEVKKSMPCPSCQAHSVTIASGCMTCGSCGYSKC